MFVGPFQVLYGYPLRRSLSHDHPRTLALPSPSRRHLSWMHIFAYELFALFVTEFEKCGMKDKNFPYLTLQINLMDLAYICLV